MSPIGLNLWALASLRLDRRFRRMSDIPTDIEIARSTAYGRIDDVAGRMGIPGRSSDGYRRVREHHRTQSRCVLEI